MPYQFLDNYLPPGCWLPHYHTTFSPYVPVPPSPSSGSLLPLASPLPQEPYLHASPSPRPNSNTDSNPNRPTSTPWPEPARSAKWLTYRRSDNPQVFNTFYIFFYVYSRQLRYSYTILENKSWSLISQAHTQVKNRYGQCLGASATDQPKLVSVQDRDMWVLLLACLLYISSYCMRWSDDGGKQVTSVRFRSAERRVEWPPFPAKHRFPTYI